MLDLDALEAGSAIGVPSLVCLMLANNETGVIQPVRGGRGDLPAGMVRCCMWMRFRRLGAWRFASTSWAPIAMAISSHKLGGPAGVGALLLAPDAPFAGAADRRRRTGTRPSWRHSGGRADRRFRRRGAGQRRRTTSPCSLSCATQPNGAAIACGAVVCGDPGSRLPNTTCLALPGVAAGVQVIALDLERIAVSAGAACSSGKVQTSHVLQAMGLGPLAGQAIRVSLPWNVTQADIDAFAAAYPRVAARLRAGLVSHAA